jgi:hypothetical protein
VVRDHVRLGVAGERAIGAKSMQRRGSLLLKDAIVDHRIGANGVLEFGALTIAKKEGYR